MNRVLIVEARFYPHISDALYDGAAHALDIAGVFGERLEVAGALEIPTAIKLAGDRYDGSFPSRSDPMAALTCGQANDSGLAISKCPAPGIKIRRT